MVDIAEKEFKIPIRKSTIPNHRSNEKRLTTHRNSQIMWMIWYYQASILSYQLGGNFNCDSRRIGTEKSAQNQA